MSHGLVCSEVNLALVLGNAWWLDSGATTNISVSMKGFLNNRRPNDVERYIYVGDGKSVEVEAIRHFRLIMCTRFYLDLKDIFVVPSFRRNLILVSYLDKSGYFCSFENNMFKLSFNSGIVGTGSLMGHDNLYLLGTIATYEETLNVESHGTKHKIDDKNSGELWHKHLGYISKNKVERILSDGILDSIDLTNFDVCVECVQGKQTKTKEYVAYRVTNVLELIHTDICGPFPTPS